MDSKPNTQPPAMELQCPYCGSNSKALVGVAEERREHRMKCRKCDSEFWENQATGLVQMTVNDNGQPE